MDDAQRELVTDVHAAPTMLVYEFAGAGVGALWSLHAVAGSSRTVLEAVDRYTPRSLSEVVGGSGAAAVSPEVAARLAEHALGRARHLRPAPVPVVGIGCTATIATDRVKRGAHRACVAAASELGVHHIAVALAKGERDRAGEEALVSSIVLDAIAAACGVLGRRGGAPVWEAGGDRHGEHRDERFEPSPELAALLRGDAAVVALDPEGGVRVDPAWPAGEAALVSGSFNPLHAGHLGLAAAAERHLGRRVSFELSIVNAEKPPLEPLELHRRAAQFPGRAPLVLTRDALFVDKARRFRGCVFVVGADTAARVLDARFYGGTAERDQALQALRAAGGRFLVAGRQSGERFLTIDDLALPTAGEGLFEALPREAFRSDLSSSAIRDSWRERV